MFNASEEKPKHVKRKSGQFDELPVNKLQESIERNIEDVRIIAKRQKSILDPQKTSTKSMLSDAQLALQELREEYGNEDEELKRDPH